jgi:hypothetical protein
MPLATKLMLTAGSLALMLTIVRLVQRRRLDEKFALLWLVGGVVMIVAPLSSRAIDVLSTALGFHYPPAFVLLVGFVALCAINLQFSVVISRLNAQHKRLAQRFALVERRLRDAEARGGPDR